MVNLLASRDRALHVSSPRCVSESGVRKRSGRSQSNLQSAVSLQDGGAGVDRIAAALLSVCIACIERGVSGLDAVTIKGPKMALCDGLLSAGLLGLSPVKLPRGSSSESEASHWTPTQELRRAIERHPISEAQPVLGDRLLQIHRLR
jgi:hypothetical protein